MSRYARHICLGPEGQERLRKARVLCVGAGGLGSVLLMYLAAAGVGVIGVVDDDVVELVNLPRQVLYGEGDVGKRKVEVAGRVLEKMNSEGEVVGYGMRLGEENAEELIGQYDVIADCTDNYNARYLISDTCARLGKPDVFASVSQFEGQCTVLCVKGAPCYRCIYPEAPPEGLFPDNVSTGVLGMVPGILGLIQASEVVKCVVDIGESLVGRFLFIDVLHMKMQEFKVQRNRECRFCT